MGLGTIIHLEGTSASVSTGGYGPSKTLADWRLHITAKLPRRERIELETSESKDELDVFVNFRRAQKELQAHVAKVTGSPAEEISGMLSYCEPWEDEWSIDGRDAALFFEIYVGPDVMDQLLAFARAGRFPREFSLHVQGMSYGNAPDGSEMKWDNVAKRCLAITEADFTLPLEPKADEPLPGEPRTSVGADLVPILREGLKWLKGVGWGIAVLIGLTIARG